MNSKKNRVEYFWFVRNTLSGSRRKSSLCDFSGHFRSKHQKSKFFHYRVRFHNHWFTWPTKSVFDIEQRNRKEVKKSGVGTRLETWKFCKKSNNYWIGYLSLWFWHGYMYVMAGGGGGVWPRKLFSYVFVSWNFVSFWTWKISANFLNQITF